MNLFCLIPILCLLAPMTVTPDAEAKETHSEFGEEVRVSRDRAEAFDQCVDSLSGKMAGPEDAEAASCLATSLDSGRPMSAACEAIVADAGKIFEANVMACVAKWENGRKSK